MIIKTTKSAKVIIEKYGDIIPELYRSLLNDVITGLRAFADIPFQEIERWDKTLKEKNTNV